MSKLVQSRQMMQRFRALAMLGLLARYGSEDEIEIRFISTGTGSGHAKLL